MKKIKLILLLSFILTNSVLFSQTLFVPGGTVGATGTGTIVPGNVGIGTSTPLSKLAIGYDLTTALSTTGITLGTDQNSIEFLNSSFGNGYGAKLYGMDQLNGLTSFRLAVRGGSSTWTDALFVRIANDNGETLGFMGLGTDDPKARLHVAGSSILGNAFNSWTSFGSPDGGRIRGSSEGYLVLSSNPNGTGDKNIYYETQAGYNHLMLGGNIGMGTTTPSNKLHVVGSAGDSNAGIIRLDGAGANATLLVGINTDYAWMQSHGQRPLRINELGNDVLFNTTGGNVGIGTNITDAKLTVRGDIHTREVRVDVTGGTGPDYVFGKDYNLLSLSELETYITQNKHLPEVPSAKEMETNGLNLKEMNLILLKKVEELTLHLINLEKRDSKQQLVIEKQNKRIVDLERKLKN